MHLLVKELLVGLRFGELAVVNSIAMMPVFSDQRCNIEYLTIDEAVKIGGLRITEVSVGGSVPYLNAENLCDKLILLIDGEELIGARQNRILNLSILLKPKSVSTIPVSCVERGRWSYKTLEFRPSEYMMPVKARAQKTKSVSLNIAACASPMSEQYLVWEEVSVLHKKAGTRSPSEASYDVFLQKKREIERFLNSLKSENGQIGYLLFVEDKPQVLEIIPNPKKYASYHRKFAAASVIDAIGDKLMDISTQKDIDYNSLTGNFINSIMACKEIEFNPVGCGINLRYDSDAVVGAALIYEKSVMHAVFFGMYQA